MADAKKANESKKAGMDKKVKDENKLIDDKQKALGIALAGIEKSFGKGAVMKFGEKIETTSIDVVPTGALSIDVALGTGGIPRGRIIEIYGPESSGKTTVTLHIIAQVQKLGGVAAFIDAEHALDPVYAKKLGVNIDELYISQPDDGEQALEITEAMVRSSAIDIVVIDSVAALVPKAEIDGEMGDSHMGLHARLMSQALRKLTGIVSKNNCIVIFTNQLRDKIGVMFGSPETTTGGRALKFYASIRLDIRKAEAIKINGEIVGNRTKLKVAKNKLAPPFKVVEFDIIYGEGISKTGDVLDLALDLNIANKSGAWFSYGETRLGQGRENAKLYLKENPDVLLEMENAVRKEHGFKLIETEQAKEDVSSENNRKKDIGEGQSKPKKDAKKKDEADEEIKIEVDIDGDFEAAASAIDEPAIEIPDELI